MLATILSVLLSFASANGTTTTACINSSETHSGTHLQRTWLESSGICMVSLSPTDAYKDLVYRDYSFLNDGTVMIFNNYGPNGEFGVRDFIFFPRSQSNVRFQWNDNLDELYITHVTGDVFTFDARTASLKSFSGGDVKVAKKVSKSNNGGVEFSGYKNLLMDVGFTLNQDPSENVSAMSRITSASGTCSLKNTNIFQYKSDGDIVFKYRTDKDFYAYLKNVCPKILP